MKLFLNDSTVRRCLVSCLETAELAQIYARTRLRYSTLPAGSLPELRVHSKATIRLTHSVSKIHLVPHTAPIYPAPLTDVSTEIVGKGYGMPSSHSQFVAFFSLSLTLFLMFRHQTTTHTSYRPSTFLERLALSILACFCAAIVALSRIYLNYHTPRQVWVGFAAGLAFALAWFIFTSYLRSAGWIEWGLDLDIARQLRFRDLVMTEDLQDAGWGRWEAQRKAKRGVPNGPSLKKKAR